LLLTFNAHKDWSFSFLVIEMFLFLPEKSSSARVSGSRSELQLNVWICGELVSTKELDRNSILGKVIPSQADVVINVVPKARPTFVTREVFALTKPGLDARECLARDDSRALLAPRSVGEVDLLAVEKILGSRGGCCSRSNLLVEEIIFLGEGAVDIEPPVTDEILLVEDSSVRTEEGVLEKTSNAVIGADVEALAVGLRVAIVPFYLAVTGEGGVRRHAIHWVILTRLPWYSLGQRGQLLTEAR